MRKTLSAATALLLMLIVVEKAYPGDRTQKAIAEKERLLPFTTWYDPDVRPILEQKLLLTPANYGRMIRMYVPNVGEYAVSVYSMKSSVPAEKCYVTLTKAQANLDYIMNSHREEPDPLREVRKVKVDRKDAEISRATASQFRRCLSALLPDHGDHRVDPAVGTGFDRFEFWLEESDGSLRKGEAPIHPNRKIQALIKMGDLLARYCETAESNRQAILSLIQAEADRILRK
jgi:hypothetical protein